MTVMELMAASLQKHRRPVRHSNKKKVNFSCGNCVPFVKATKFFVAGSSQTIIWYIFVIFPLGLLLYYCKIVNYIDSTYVKWHLVNVLDTLCIGNKVK